MAIRRVSEIRIGFVAERRQSGHGCGLWTTHGCDGNEITRTRPRSAFHQFAAALEDLARLFRDLAALLVVLTAALEEVLAGIRDSIAALLGLFDDVSSRIPARL